MKQEEKNFKTVTEQTPKKPEEKSAMKISENLRRTLKFDRIIVCFTAAAAALVYLLTFAPTVSFWDSGEYITASFTAGIPHPPGVPLFVLLGRFFISILLPVSSIAVRVNLMCVFSGILSVAIVTRLVQRWASRMEFAPGVYRPMSILAGLLSAFSYTVWRNNNGTETYAVAHLFAVMLLWIFDLWLVRRREGKPGGRYLILVGYLIMLSVANHLSALIVVAPIVLVVLLYTVRRYSRIIFNVRFLFLLIGLMTIAFSVHLFMPLRAIQRPGINETDPSEWPAFRYSLERKQYGTVSILNRKGPFLEQLALYARFLSWQTGRPESWDVIKPLGRPLSLLVRLILTSGAIYGLGVLGKRRKDLLFLIGFTFLMASFFFVVYLNFKTGPVGTTLGEVRDRDYFFGASFTFFSILSAIGLTSFLSDLVGNRNRLLYSLLVFPGISLAVNYYHCDRSGDYVAHDYGINLLETCTEGAVLITNGDNDTFPLWFVQGVLGVRRDVIISNLSLMNTTWYVEQLLDRDPDLLNFTYEGVDLREDLQPVFVWGPNFFHVSENGYPETFPLDGWILRSTFNQVWPWGIIGNGIAIAIPNDGMGTQGVITMQELVLLNMIQQQPIHGRDIFLAATVSVDNRAYVKDHLVMEGIAFRVVPETVVDAVNADRGWNLLHNYNYTGLRDRSIYKDDQAHHLVRNYVSAYHRIAYHHLGNGEIELAMAAVDSCVSLLSEMPALAVDILPQTTLIKARIIDGLYGTEAAADTVFKAVEIVARAAEETSSSRLAAAAGGLQQLGLEYDQEESFHNFINELDTLDCNHAAVTWLGIEVDLAFGNYISARRRIREELEADPLNQLALLAQEELEDFIRNTPIDQRFNLGQGGLAFILQMPDSVYVEDILWNMVEQVAAGRNVSGISSGLVIAALMSDNDAKELIETYTATVLELSEISVERALWFLMEMQRSDPSVVAYRCAGVGDVALTYLALSAMENNNVALQAFLDDVSTYMANIPKNTGAGEGPYSWLQNVFGES